MPVVLTVGEPARVPFRGLPRLDAQHEDDQPAERQPPLPPDAPLLEHLGVQARDVHRRKHGDEADHDGPEEELVLPDVAEEGERAGHEGAVLAAAVAERVEIKHAVAEVLELPGGDEDLPGELGEDGRAGAEDDVADVAAVAIAVDPEVPLAVADAVDDDDEGEQRRRTHDQAVDQHVDDDLPREDALLRVVGRAVHHGRGGLLAAETEGGKRRGQHVDPENLQRRQREHGRVGPVLERESDDQEHDFADVRGEQVEDELLDVFEHASALLDGVDDTGEVVVRKYDVGGCLRNVGPAHTHGDTNIGGPEGRGVVDTVTGHGTVAIATVEGGDHASLRLRGAASDHKGQTGHSIDLLVGHAVELGCGFDERSSLLSGQRSEVLRDNADFLGDG